MSRNSVCPSEAWFEREEDDIMPPSLDGEMFERIKANDPTVTWVAISFEIPPDFVDWDTEAKWIGSNTHLKGLCVYEMQVDEYHDDPEFEIGQFEAFCKGLAQNRSIEHIEFSGLYHPDMFQILSPFIVQNPNLRSLSISSCFDQRTPDSSLLASALSGRENTTALDLFCFHSNNLEDGRGRAIFEALRNQTNLRKISLHYNKIGRDLSAVADLLRNPDSKLRELDMFANHIDDECALILAGGLAENSGLKALILEEVGPDQSWLVGLALRDSAIETLELQKNCIGDEAAMALAEAMVKAPAIKKVCIGNNRIANDGARALASALTKSSTMVALEFGHNKSITPNGWEQFCTVLRNGSSLEALELNSNQIGDHVAVILANSLPYLSELELLELRHTGIGNGGFIALAQALSTCPTLKELTVASNGIGSEGLIALAEVLPACPTLKHLNVAANPSITNQGWVALSNGLQNASIEGLDLQVGANMIGDEELGTLIDVLVSCNVLKTLNLMGSSITNQGWLALANVLQRPNLRLKELYLGMESKNDDVVIAFADALATGNNHLKILDLGSFYDANISDRGWTAVMACLCDTSSIVQTFTSNHTLEYLTEEFWSNSLPDKVDAALHWNHNGNKFELARQKIMRHHFSGAASDLGVFARMKTNVMPHAISWLGVDDSGHTLLYCVLRAELAGIVSVGKGKVGREKRKRTAEEI
ncbi:hypothetical protein ACHAXT_006562 [Thalassiosira profunda]